MCIRDSNTGESRGRETSHSLNYQKLGKELLSKDELAVMDGGKCILQRLGVRPFLSDKFNITKHPNYKYLSDYDKKNAFDIERFLSARLKSVSYTHLDVYKRQSALLWVKGLRSPLCRGGRPAATLSSV